ncbi:hypothetical protein Tco_0413838 [Tanacetum coccineum]
MRMSPSRDLRNHVSHAVPPPDIRARFSSALLFPKCQEQYTATVTQIRKEITHQGLRISLISFSPVEGGGPKGQDDQEETLPPLTKEQIEGHVSALKSIIKDHNQRNETDPIRLDFELEDTKTRDDRIVKGKEVVNDDLKKPFKEALKMPLTHRIIKFAGPKYKMPTKIKLYDRTTDPEDHLSRFASAANSGEWPMPVWCRMFQKTFDGSAMGWFECLPANSINEWSDLREEFAARYSVRRACFKEPHEITKIVRRDNESLTAFKERWTVETGFIMGVPEVPTTVNEMMVRLDDFVWSEEAYSRTELPKGESRDLHSKVSLLALIRDDRPYRGTHSRDARRNDSRSKYRGRDTFVPKKGRDYRASYPPPRRDYNNRVAPVLTLDSLTKYPKEILATETQLRLPAPRPMLNPLRAGNTDRYYDYHQEKGHYMNDCIQLRKQLEMALESGKLNHLVKDVRQRGRGPHGMDAPQPPKVINMIIVSSVKDKKWKTREATEAWMDTPITFPPISSEDVFDEPLIVEAEVERYLVRQVYVDEGSSVEVMFEHCFENLNSGIKARLKETQIDLVWFAGEISKPLGKIELEVSFGNEDVAGHSIHHSFHDEISYAKVGYLDGHYRQMQAFRKEANGRGGEFLRRKGSKDNRGSVG